MTTEDLTQEILSLQEQSNSLTRDIRFEDHPLKKQSLINKKADVDHEILKLRAKQDIYNEKVYDEKTTKLIQDQRLFIFFQAGSQVIKIPSDLVVQIRFSCGHKRKMNVKEVLRGYTFEQNIRTPEPNTRLYEKWHNLLTGNSTVTGSMNCQECRSSFEELKRKFGRWSDKEVGRCSFVLRRLQ